MAVTLRGAKSILDKTSKCCVNSRVDGRCSVIVVFFFDCHGAASSFFVVWTLNFQSRARSLILIGVPS